MIENYLHQSQMLKTVFLLIDIRHDPSENDILMVPLLVPLFVSAFRRANDLAMAMEARCYHGGDSRTQMKPLRFRKRDGIAFLIIALFLAASILFCIFGGFWI